VRTEHDTALFELAFELPQRRRDNAAAQIEAQIAQTRLEQPLIRPAGPGGGARGGSFSFLVCQGDGSACRESGQ